MAQRAHSQDASTGPPGRLDLPPDLVERIDARLPRSAFDSVDEYVAYVLREVLVRVENETETEPPSVDPDQVDARLRALGYLD